MRRPSLFPTVGTRTSRTHLCLHRSGAGGTNGFLSPLAMLIEHAQMQVPGKYGMPRTLISAKNEPTAHYLPYRLPIAGPAQAWPQC
jgi:hypothetical protein